MPGLHAGIMHGCCLACKHCMHNVPEHKDKERVEGKGGRKGIKKVIFTPF